MKNIKFLAVLAALVFTMSTVLNAQLLDCWDSGYDCGPWTQASFTYEDPLYPGCIITILYNFQICHENYNNVVSYNFEFIGMYYSKDGEACDGLDAALNSGSDYDPAKQNILYNIWKGAFKKISEYWFNQLDPLAYRCGVGSMKYRTVVPGGCISWCIAKRTNTSGLIIEIAYFPVPCASDGCCIIDRELCWDHGEPKETYSTTAISGNTPCNQCLPLYNPLVKYNYGDDWSVDRYLPCFEGCLLFVF